MVIWCSLIKLLQLHNLKLASSVWNPYNLAEVEGSQYYLISIHVVCGENPKFFFTVNSVIMTGFPEDITWIENITTNLTFPNLTFSNKTVDIMMVVRLIMSSVGIIGNFTVIIVFLSHRKFRKKIPNIFIINQVSDST